MLRIKNMLINGMRNTYIDDIISKQINKNNGCADFSGIHLSENDMQRICDRLKNSENIQSLNLSHCSLNLISARPLIGLLQTNKNIIDVDYTSNKIGFEIEYDVVAALEKNKKEMASNVVNHKMTDSPAKTGLFKPAKEITVIAPGPYLQEKMKIS